jgi:membrane protease YdiL (CAAX protease family)
MSGMGFYSKSGEMLARIISATLMDIVLITSVIYFATSFYGRGLGSLGLTAKGLLKGVRYGFLGYIGFVPVFICVVLAVYWLSSVFEVTLEPQAIVEMFKDEKHPATLFYMSVFAGLLGPVVEEVFFRGFLYGALRKHVGIIGGVVISALLFALLHANLASFFPILALGALLAYLYEKTGSLTASITVHVAHNTLMLIFLFLAKRLYA